VPYCLHRPSDYLLTESGEHFSRALEANPPNYASEQKLNVFDMVRTKNAIYVDRMDRIQSIIDEFVEDNTCRDFKISRLNDLESFWYAIIVSKNSTFFEEINFAVTTRSMILQMNKRKRIGSGMSSAGTPMSLGPSIHPPHP
jgi:hypothetical protein